MPPRRILSLWFPRLAAERVLRAEPRLAERRSPSSPTGAARWCSRASRRRPRRRGSGAAWRSATPGRSAGAGHPARGPAPRGGLPRARCGAGPGASRPGSPRRAGGAGARRHRLRAALRRRGRARRAGRGRGGRPRPHASGSGSPTPRARPGRWRATPGPAPGRPMPATRSTRRRAPPARGRRSAAGSAAAPPPPRRAGAERPTASCRPGATLAHIGPLPVAALRLEPDEVEPLQALGLAPDRRSRGGCRGRSSPGASAPRWSRRLDQALGRAPEPVSPAPPAAGLRAAPELPRADRAAARTSSPASTGCCRRSATGCAPPARARGGCG